MNEKEYMNRDNSQFFISEFAEACLCLFITPYG